MVEVGEKGNKSDTLHWIAEKQYFAIKIYNHSDFSSKRDAEGMNEEHRANIERELWIMVSINFFRFGFLSNSWRNFLKDTLAAK